jgi:SDR family mycofactocin-dependent oxidoreductase
MGAATLGQSTSRAEESSSSQTRPQTNFSLEGKSAIVTGAARGIGRAIAVALAHAGADVMVIDIAGPASAAVIYPAASKEELAETVRLVKQENRRAIPLVADVREIGALRDAADRANRELGKIDIIVANAGIQIYSPISEMSDQQWNDVINVNLTGTGNTIRAVVPHMIPRKSGRVILIASGQGRHGMKDGSAYSASKWGIIGLMKSVALELGRYQITVNSIQPGLVDTPMTRNPGRWNLALEEAGKKPEDQPEEKDVIAARLPISTMKIPWMQPSDVAPVAVFLGSDAAYRVTGSTYDATAGDSAHYTA